MAFETKELSGALFHNGNKDRDAQPDYTGNVKINGKIWRLAAWNSESRSGDPYLSIKVSDPEEYRRQQEGQGQTPKPPSGRLTNEDFQRRREQNRPRPSPEHDFSDDDIPF